MYTLCIKDNVFWNACNNRKYIIVCNPLLQLVWHVGSVTGRFLKIHLVKVAQIVWWLFWLFENITFQVKTAVSTCLATIGKLWATFYFNIWSHCTQLKQNFYLRGLVQLTWRAYDDLVNDSLLSIFCFFNWNIFWGWIKTETEI